VLVCICTCPSLLAEGGLVGWDMCGELSHVVRDLNSESG
jgi:hypothetical protein